jgi:hypothetical protein
MARLIFLTLAISQPIILKSQVDHSLDPRIRPCTPAEFATGISEEVTRLIASGPNYGDGKPTFVQCEAVDLPWLPNATILRFHTPVDVDYSSTFTFARATPTSRLWLVRSAEGMVGLPSVNEPDNLIVINDLLASADPTPEDSELASISNFYFFLLDHEGGLVFFFTATVEHASLLKDYEATFNENGNIRLVTLKIDSLWWLFTYSRSKIGVQLNSVVLDKTEEED